MWDWWHAKQEVQSLIQQLHILPPSLLLPFSIPYMTQCWLPEQPIGKHQHCHVGWRVISHMLLIYNCLSLLLWPWKYNKNREHGKTTKYFLLSTIKQFSYIWQTFFFSCQEKCQVPFSLIINKFWKDSKANAHLKINSLNTFKYVAFIFPFIESSIPLPVFRLPTFAALRYGCQLHYTVLLWGSLKSLKWKCNVSHSLISYVPIIGFCKPIVMRWMKHQNSLSSKFKIMMFGTMGSCIGQLWQFPHPL